MINAWRAPSGTNNGDRCLTTAVAQQIIDAAHREAAALTTRAAEVEAVIELLTATPIEIEN